MTFSANAGRIRVTDAEGNERIDTDDGLFHILTEGISDQIAISAVTVANGSSAGVRNRTDTWNLGSCHPACTHVIGAVRFAASGSFAIGYARWTTYLGGSLVWSMTAPGLTSGTAGTIADNMTTVCVYRFYVEDGAVFMERRMCLPEPPGSNFFTLVAHTIDYRLKAGLFT